MLKVGIVDGHGHRRRRDMHPHDRPLPVSNERVPDLDHAIEPGEPFESSFTVPVRIVASAGFPGPLYPVRESTTTTVPGPPRGKYV